MTQATYDSKVTIQDHLEALRRALPGPARPREELLGELADGLHDQAEAYRDTGLSAAEAEAQTVRESGTVAELVAAYAAELAAAQGRRTALLLAITGPGLLCTWDVLWANGAGWAEASPTVRLLSDITDWVSYAFGAVGFVAFLLLTWWMPRRGRDGRRVVQAVSVVGVVGVMTVVCASIGMNVLQGGPHLLEPSWFVPLTCVSLLSAAVLCAQLRSLWRTLRGLRVLATSRPPAAETGR